MENENKEIFPITHGIIATVPHPTDNEKLSVLHFVGFEGEPGEAEYQAIHDELKSDPEFGLQDVDFTLSPAPEHVVEHFKTHIDFEFADKAEEGKTHE